MAAFDSLRILAEGAALKLIILDRDGTINVDKYVTYRPDQLELTYGAREALMRLSLWGFEFAVVSNQTGIGRGDYDEAAMWQFNDLLMRELAPLPLTRDDFYFCPHDTSQQACECAKPNPHMLLKAAQKHGVPIEQCYMIGDKMSDILAGKRAGCKKTILVRTGITDDREKHGPVTPDYEVDDLLKAAELITALEGIE